VINEDLAREGYFETFISQLWQVECLNLSVNGNELQFGDQLALKNALESDGLSVKEIKKSLSIPSDLTLSKEEIALFGVHHDSKLLHDYGEINYQLWFNEQNVGKRKTCLLDATGSAAHHHGTIPIPKQPRNNIIPFCTQINNLSCIRTMGIDIKGGPYDPTTQESSSRSLTGKHFQVLEQSLRRIYSMSSVQQYLGKIGMFAICFDRIWFISYERKHNRSKCKQEESIDILTINPSDLSELWAILTVEALRDPDIIYVQGNHDSCYLSQFLNSLHPDSFHYCRTRFVAMSMNQVYAISLPQLSTIQGNVSLGISSKDKHFALKVISSQSQFIAEVECITRINQYIEKNDGVLGDGTVPVPFYAIGFKPWGGNLECFNAKYTQIDFESIKNDLVDVFKGNEVIGSFSSLTMHDEYDQPVVPWWLHQPIPSKPLNGGVIVMHCGDLYCRPDSNSLSSLMDGVTYWLNLYHDAGVLHRDIRFNNMVRFSNVPSHYTPSIIESADNKAVTEATCLQWQLIDFNTACCLAEDRSEVKTILQRNSSQYLRAGWLVKRTAKQSEDSETTFKYSWRKYDDIQMLVDCFSKTQN
jgi:hypothetical protein